MIALEAGAELALSQWGACRHIGTHTFEGGDPCGRDELIATAARVSVGCKTVG